MKSINYCKVTKNHSWLKKGVIIHLMPHVYIYYILIGKTEDDGLLYLDSFTIDKWIGSGCIKIL